MPKRRILLTFPFLIFFSLHCVETLITVRVFPDGRFSMEMLSRGDSTDVFDRDFKHPSGPEWTSTIDQEQGEDEVVWSLNSFSILEGGDAYHPEVGVGALEYPILVEKQSSFLFATYTLKHVFIGRRAFQKYPKFAKSLDQTLEDSTRWISEVLFYITSRAMEDLQADEINRLEIKDYERIQNHLRNTFHRVEEFDLYEDLAERQAFYYTSFQPFMRELPAGYLQALFSAMHPYEEEMTVTLGLKDDQFIYRATLPGLITHTNADSVSGDTLIWYFGLEDFINDDYIISAKSVVYFKKGVQIIIIGGTLVLLILLTLWVKRRTSR